MMKIFRVAKMLVMFLATINLAFFIEERHADLLITLAFLVVALGMVKLITEEMEGLYDDKAND